ncbi:MAG: CRTAC1 family protein [Planctomycetaceae bacterium]
MNRRWLLVGMGLIGLMVLLSVVLRSNITQHESPPEMVKSIPQTVSDALRAGDVHQNSTPETTDSPIQFRWMTAQSGVELVYYGSPSVEKYMTEQNGGGVALFDFDNDDQLDLFLVNGDHFQRPAQTLTDSNRLYRSQSEGFQFDDVTFHSGIEATGCGMGCAVADFNNDGFADLFVAYYGRNKFWRNNGDGTFEEISMSAGLESDAWSSSAAFADFDSDGDVDLYVANYVQWTPGDPPCFFPHTTPVRIPCSPMSHAGQADHLFCNQGDGTFQEIGEISGITEQLPGKGLGVAVADFDADQRLDIYVANDMTPNFLFHNLGGMQFREVAVREGVAISEDGTIAAGMGVAVGDYNRDGQCDIFVTNFKDQVHDAFMNLGGDGFVAANWQLGLDSLSRSKLSFGVVLADFDLDSFPDLFVANGHVWNLTAIDSAFQYEMQQSVYRNESGKRFVDVSATAGDYFTGKWVGRAAAVGDLDNDGDSDIVVTHLGNPPGILQNTSIRQGDSFTLRLVGVEAARQPLGISVVVTIGDRQILTQIPSGGSFQSSHEPQILVTIPKGESVSRVTVHWSVGSIETWEKPSVEGDLILIQGRDVPFTGGHFENNQ